MTFDYQVVGIFVRITIPKSVDNQFTVITRIVTVHGDGFVIAYNSGCRCCESYRTGIIQMGYSGITIIVPSGTVIQFHRRSACRQCHGAVQYCAIGGGERVGAGYRVEYISRTGNRATVYADNISSAVCFYGIAVSFYGSIVQHSLTAI